MAFTKSELLGTWELSNNSAKGCVDGFIKPIIVQGQVLITFKEDNTYEQQADGIFSNGNYIVDLNANDIQFIPVFNQKSAAVLKPFRMKVAIVEDDVLTFLMQDGCGIYEQPYHKVLTQK